MSDQTILVLQQKIDGNWLNTGDFYGPFGSVTERDEWLEKPDNSLVCHLDTMRYVVEYLRK